MSLSLAVGQLKVQADLQRGRKLVVPCNVCTSFSIKFVELLLQLGQVMCDQVQRCPISNRFGAEQPRGRVVKAVVGFRQDHADQSRAGHGLDVDGLVLQLNGGVGHDDFLYPQTLERRRRAG